MVKKGEKRNNIDMRYFDGVKVTSSLCEFDEIVAQDKYATGCN